jgi:hypothetical protein
MPPLWRPAPQTGKRSPLVVTGELVGLVESLDGPGWPRYLSQPPGGGMEDLPGYWREPGAANDSEKA